VWSVDGYLQYIAKGKVVAGKRTELAGRLQQRYGYAKDQADREIDTWLRDTV
jgi:uncharacterized protein YjbJ (UPF0337 family)